ncbi:aquaporin-5 [Amia ocellicauda]|uniref:aquaporin-5 n=1 Tax=Amia ocellicauda TaxID=2972642 RepID=UPI003464209F
MLGESRIALMLKEVWTLAFLRDAFFEFAGTAFFLFASLASTIQRPAQGAPYGPFLMASADPTQLPPEVPHRASPDPLHLSVTFGISVALVSLCLGSAGGVHLNPAVTVAFLAGVRVSPLRAFLYIIAQLLGSMASCALLLVVTPAADRGELGLNAPSSGVSEYQALCVEMFITFQLVLCVLVSSDAKLALTKLAPFVIGLSVTLGHLVAIGFTGCSMNPARSFGPAVVSVNFSSHWVFWAGPMAGAVLAALLHDLILFPRWSDRSAWLKDVRQVVFKDLHSQPSSRDIE